MKINIKNLLFQPLALHLATNSEGLHFAAREVREILTESISQEIQLAAARGLVSLVGKVSDGLDHALGSTTVEDAPETTAAVDDPGTRQKKGRAK